MRAILIGVSLLNLVVSGCGPSNATYEMRAGEADFVRSQVENSAGRGDVEASPSLTAIAQPPDAEQAAQRKIVYDASISLHVDDLKALETSLAKRLREAGGFIADFRQTSTSGDPTSLYWKLRVPVDRFDAFVGSLDSLGSVYDRRLKSQDVTAEFFDVESRLRNKKATEERLLAHLRNREGKVDEIIGVEKEIDRVREQIEQMEGRLRLLSNLTSLATVEINASTVVKFQPTTPPSFVLRIKETFGSSVDGMIVLGQNIVLFLVALGPWLPIVAIVIWLFYRAMKRMFSRPPQA